MALRLLRLVLGLLPHSLLGVVGGFLVLELRIAFSDEDDPPRSLLGDLLARFLEEMQSLTLFF